MQSNNKFEELWNRAMLACLVLTIFVCWFKDVAAQTPSPYQITTPPAIDQQRLVFCLRSPNPTVVEQLGQWARESRATVSRKFPKHQAPEQATINGYPTADLSLIYEVYWPSKQPLKHLENDLQLLRNLPAIAWAEPLYAHELFRLPNDPHANPNTGGQANYLSLIRAYDAWNITSGDTSVKIGIVDSGLDIANEDLTNKIALNLADPINGFDDDGNGLIDDLYGWNFFDNNNNLSIAQASNGHGQTVASISSAQGNNARGMAGVAFGSPFVPVVVFGPNNSSRDAYAGIVYAADRGCKVINLSWGRQNNNPSEYERTIIRYAAINKNATLVAAAGNTPAELDFLPASYDHVLSVAYTDYNSNLDPNATWSTFVDLSAPGANIWSINATGGYSAGASGSSFAAPMVAAACALVRTAHPFLNAQQAAELVRVNTDDNRFSSVNQNRFDKVGSGRLNVAQAVARTRNIAMRLENIVATNRRGSPLLANGDTVELRFQLRNFLSTVLGGQVSVSVTSGNASVISGGSWTFGALASMATAHNAQLPLRIRLGNNGVNQKVYLQFRFTASGYTDFQSHQLVVNQSFLHIGSERFSNTYGDNGRISYVDIPNTIGAGIRLDNQLLAGTGGLVVAATPTRVPNSVMDTTGKDAHFLNTQRWRITEETPTYLQASQVMTDSLFGRNRPGLRISQQLRVYKQVPANRAHVLELEVSNTGSQNWDSLSVALLMDWNLQNWRRNRTDYDTMTRTAYAFSLPAGIFTETPVAGIRVLGGGDPQVFASDLTNTVTGTNVNFNGGFSLADKFRCASRGLLRTQAGWSLSTGNDIASLVGAKIRGLAPGQRKRVALAIGAGYSLQELNSALSTAAALYTQGRVGPMPQIASQTICYGSEVNLAPANGQIFKFYDRPSLSTPIAEGRFLHLRGVRGPRTVWITNADSLFESAPTVVNINVAGPEADFEMVPPMLILSQGNNVTFQNRSRQADRYLWDFGNGQTSTAVNPVVTYTVPGVYNVKLQSWSNASACTDSLVLPLRVWATTNLATGLNSKLTVRHSATSWQWDVPCPYQLLNAAGALVTHGSAANLSHAGLPKGVYFLHLSPVAGANFQPHRYKVVVP